MIRTLFAVGCLVFVSACSTPHRADLGKIYNRSAQAHGPGQNPVVVIPGILGTRLETRGGEVVWGAFGGGGAHLGKAHGARALAIPMREGVPLSDLKDDVVPAGALESVNVNLFGLPIELRAYRRILQVLGAGGYTDPDVAPTSKIAEPDGVDFGDDHFTCFQFGYDWRLDLVENAARLDAFLAEKQAEVAEEYRTRFGIENPNVRFDIVGHSAGALLTRYYLRYGGAEPIGEPTWAGAARIENAVLIAPPNAGSVKSFTELQQGMNLKPLFRIEPAVISTLPAVYQLMPRDRHGAFELADGESAYDVAVWERNGWGALASGQDAVLRQLLPGVERAADRRRIARDHLQKCLERAESVHRALDREAVPPAGTRMHVVIGDAIPTPSRVKPGSDGTFEVTDWQPGDGTVIRSSALLDERVGGDWQPKVRSPLAWSSVRFIFEDHLGLTGDAEFHDNLLYLLLEAP